MDRENPFAWHPKQLLKPRQVVLEGEEQNPLTDEARGAVLLVSTLHLRLQESRGRQLHLNLFLGGGG